MVVARCLPCVQFLIRPSCFIHYIVIPSFTDHVLRHDTASPSLFRALSSPKLSSPPTLSPSELSSGPLPRLVWPVPKVLELSSPVACSSESVKHSSGRLSLSITRCGTRRTKFPSDLLSSSELVCSPERMYSSRSEGFGRHTDIDLICRFGGLIAYGTSQIKSSIANWRILFLIEGCPSIILAICIFFFLPSRPDKSNYITEDERTVVHTRLNADSLGEGHTGIDWNGVKRALTDWKTYVVSIMYSAMNLTLGSVTGFLPTIIKGCVSLRYFLSFHKNSLPA